MRQEDAARVVLVRAVEETLPDRIAPETLLEAHAAAGDPAEGPAWVVHRAAYLVEHALGAYAGALERTRVVLPGPWLSVGAAALLGLGANYLGPSESIHVVLNPLVLLILWNVLVYAALFAWGVRAMRGPSRPPVLPTDSGAARATPRPRAPRGADAGGVLERLFLGAAFRWLRRARERVDDGIAEARAATAVGRRFAVLWWPVVRPALGLWLRRMLHLCAIGIAAGAVLGMYVRGLFFAYHVVWRSTFVNDPRVVAFGLACLLGPAALALGRPLPGPDDVLRLLAPGGDPAAPWIHLYAVSALLLVVVPRGVLALSASRRLRRAAGEVQLDFDAEYYRDLLQRARAVSPEKLEATVRDAVREECRQFTDRLAAFVCAELYDRRITPRLRAFRAEGGTLNDLEHALAAECEGFGPVLERELPDAERDLERALVVRVRRLLGDEGALAARPPRALAGEVSAASSQAATALGDRMGGEIAGLVAGVVSTSAAVVAGTVSGGFGKALGVALLVGVVKSGPVGWVVGAVSALAATGGALWLGREKLRAGVKAVPVPAPVLKAAFWTGRYERIIADGRAQCATTVRASLATRIDPLAATIADHVWEGLRAVVGELQRPRVAPEEHG
jgi:hypothetical protein